MILVYIAAAAILIYIGIAFGVYKWMMGSNPNTMQKSMSGFVVMMALAWPLGLVLWALDKSDKEQRP